MAEDGHPVRNGQEHADSSTPLLKANHIRGTQSTRQKVSSLFADWWLWEIISAVTCILALTVVVVILLVYDSSALPDWPSVFTV